MGEPQGWLTPLSRRRFIAVFGGTVSALALGRFGPTLLRLANADRHAQETADLGAPMIPAPPTALPIQTVRVLQDLFTAIGTEWRLMTPADRELRLALFNDFLQKKSEQAPSYFGEYRNAEQVLLARHVQTDPHALRSLLLEPSRLAVPPRTRIEHFRRYVVQEFAEFHLISGGFRVFGYRNYAGFIGGPLTTHPYR